MKKMRASTMVASILKYVFLFAMLIFAAVPLIQVLLNSFRSDREVKTMPLGFPENWGVQQL